MKMPCSRDNSTKLSGIGPATAKQHAVVLIGAEPVRL